MCCNSFTFAFFFLKSYLRCNHQFLITFFLLRNGSAHDKEHFEHFESLSQNLVGALWHFPVISPVLQRSNDLQSNYFRHLKNFLQDRLQRGCKVSDLFLEYPQLGDHERAFILSASQVTALTCWTCLREHIQPPALLATALQNWGPNLRKCTAITGDSYFISTYLSYCSWILVIQAYDSRFQPA